MRFAAEQMTVYTEHKCLLRDRERGNETQERRHLLDSCVCRCVDGRQKEKQEMLMCPETHDPSHVCVCVYVSRGDVLICPRTVAFRRHTITYTPQIDNWKPKEENNPTDLCW